MFGQQKVPTNFDALNDFGINEIELLVDHCGMNSEGFQACVSRSKTVEKRQDIKDVMFSVRTHRPLPTR